MLEFRYIKKPYWQVFTLCFLLAAMLFLPISLQDAIQGHVFHYAGDYNTQSILFWQYCNEFVKSGGSYSWVTDLGSGFLTSYAFGIIGSPFFWLSLIVPSEFMPWAMVPLFALKFAVAGSGAYLWSKRWVKNKNYAMLTGILYAFSGYSIYSIFYNTFLDTIALFPYLLMALDNAVCDGKKCEFPFWIALNLLLNYYFFIGEAIFITIYFACMLIGKKYILSQRRMIRVFAETLLGCAMGCTLLIPVAICLAQNPRTSSFLNDYGFICYSEPQKYMAILCSMFLMPDAPYSSVLFPESGTKWQNLTAYLPVLGITGGLALNRADRKHPFSMILKFSVICAFVPMLNAMFTLENANYYARWFYMPILVLCAATGIVFEDAEICRPQWNDAWKTVLVFTAGFAALGLVPSKVDSFGTRLGVATSGLIFWLIWGISIVGVIIGKLTYNKYYGTEKFIPTITSVVMIFCFVYGETHLLLTRYTVDVQSSEYGWYETYETLDEVSNVLPQDSFYRIDSADVNNYGITLNKSSEAFFSSTVSPGIFSFYNGIGTGRGVRSSIPQKFYALRSLLNSRFLFINLGNEKSWNAETSSGSDITIDENNIDEAADMLLEKDTDSVTYTPAEWASNWNEFAHTSKYVIYENANYIPMGYTYNYYITQEQYAGTDPTIRTNLLLKALVLTDEQIEKYGDKLQQLPETEFDKMTYSDFVKDCADRREQTADTFETNNFGFTATTSFDTDELVFFSVPYEKNAFTATVNGEPVDIEEVDCGLMAIPVPAGEADIVVTYHTPGLKESITISIAGIIIWILYALVCYNKGKKKGTPELQEAKESTEAVE